LALEYWQWQEIIEEKLSKILKVVQVFLIDFSYSVVMETDIIKSKTIEIEARESIHTAIENELASSHASVVRILELIIEEAHSIQASDIHIDPTEKVLRVRYRVDGILQNARSLPKSVHSSLFSRLKIISNLRIDEHNMPQDGRFSITLYESAKLDVRVAMTPTYYGENAVLRILSSQEARSFELLGFSKDHVSLIKETISRPHGLILISGPTGSGKTSSLYSCIQLLNSSEKSIITIEEPIEYSIEDITQIQVNKQLGLTFAEGLRSILRQDPNVIAIGEIRDSETASLAVHGALTGHIVLSTIHATSAAATIPRLITMGIEPYLLSSTLTLIINERLVRRLCTECTEKIVLQEFQKKLLEKIPTLNIDIIDGYFIAKGCVSCLENGNKGRIGIFEVLQVGDEIRDAINEKSSSNYIAKKAEDLGMKSLFADGIDKALKGIISLDEVMDLIYE
jgi:type IV pilus assembly protein PilB